MLHAGHLQAVGHGQRLPIGCDTVDEAGRTAPTADMVYGSAAGRTLADGNAHLAYHDTSMQDGPCQYGSLPA